MARARLLMAFSTVAGLGSMKRSFAPPHTKNNAPGSAMGPAAKISPVWLRRPVPSSAAWPYRIAATFSVVNGGAEGIPTAPVAAPSTA